MKYLLFAFSAFFLDAIMGNCSHYYLDVSSHELIFDNQRSSKEIEISSNTDWSIAGWDYSWLEVNPAAGDGDAKITVTAQPNESTNPRTCTIYIKGRDNEEVSVYQAGKPTVDNKDDGA